MDSTNLKKLIESHRETGVIPVSALESTDPAIKEFARRLKALAHTGVLKAHWSADGKTYVYDLLSLKQLLEYMGVRFLENKPLGEGNEQISS